MKKGVYVSLNCVVGIREFMSNYMGITYEHKKKLTHYEMYDYLVLKGRRTPIPVNYSKVRVEDIIDGRYVVVAEETKNRHKKGKLVIYENPKRLDIPNVMNSLKRCDKEDLRIARNKTLISEGFYENSMGEIIDIDFEKEGDNYEDYVDPSSESVKIEKENRQKTYTLTSSRHIKGRKRY